MGDHGQIGASEPAIRVMLVDSHAMVREGLCLILALEADIEVVGTAGDAQQAELLAASLQPDIMILDADLPDFAEIQARLAVVAPAAGVMILASTNDASRAVSLISAGARGYLSTLATGQTLIGAIHAISRGELVLEAVALQAVIGRFVHHAPGLVEVPEVARERLSAREREVLNLLCQGHTDKAIAQTLYLSVRTVNSHVSHIFAKLGVATRTEAMHAALQQGLVSLAPPSLTLQHP